MSILRGIVLLLALSLAAAACGSGDGPSSSAGSGGGTPPSSAESPVTMTPLPGSDVHDVEGRPEPVRPRPGMDDLRPVPWEKARQTPGGRQLRIVYWSGVEPCSVLDHVDVAYKASKIIVTLYEGSDPDEPDALCIEIALRKVVRVALEEAVNGRKLVDGAK